MTRADPRAACARRSAGPPWPAAGTIAGIGFTVSLLIATLAFDGAELEEAKIGILSAAHRARRSSTWIVFRATALLPQRSRMRALARHRRR